MPVDRATAGGYSTADSVKVGWECVWDTFSLPVSFPGRFSHPSSRTGRTTFMVPRLSTELSEGTSASRFQRNLSRPFRRSFLDHLPHGQASSFGGP
jgi:hypothetical protein